MPNEDRFVVGQRVSLQTLIINFCLTIGKLLVGVAANSSAMLADGVHSASDMLSTMGVMYSLRIAKLPPDDNHPYGHGRAESIGTKLLALSLVAVGGGILFTSFGKLLSGQYPVPGKIAIWAALLSIVIKELMFRYILATAKRINSTGLMADAWHHRSDALSSIAALIGVIGARQGFPFLDPLVGGVVALLIIKVGWEILRASIDELMDAQVSPDMLQRITGCTETVSGVLGIHQVKARRYGSLYIVDLKIGVDGDISVWEGHRIASEVKQCVMEQVDDVSDVMIHLNPQEERERESG